MPTTTLDSLRATDSLICDIGLDTPSTEDIFRSLFWTSDPFIYARENGAGDYKRCSPRWIYPKPGAAFRLEQNVFELAAKDSGKRQAGYRFNRSYKGPYRYHVTQAHRPDAVRMIFLDIDDPSIVPLLLATSLKEQAIWNRTKTSGRYHICVPIDECRYSHAEETVFAWLEDAGIRMHRDGLLKPHVESNVIGLWSMLLPGQDEFSMPCEPGAYQNPLCETYVKTRQLYADWWRYKRVALEDVFPVRPRVKQPYEIEQTAKTPLAQEKKYVKTDIPGVGISIGCTVNGQRHDYYSLAECIDESNGFLLSCSFIPALVRKHRGEEYHVIQDALNIRQALRPPCSKKNHAPTLHSHVKTTAKYFCRRYDETKSTKHDPQQELEDRTALIDFFVATREA